jgi:hypothetical protein
MWKTLIASTAMLMIAGSPLASAQQSSPAERSHRAQLTADDIATRTDSMRAIALQYVAITRFGQRVRWRTKRCAPVLVKVRVRCTTPSSR